MVEVSILSLKCPECGVGLDGMDQDVIFFCPNCLCGYEYKDKHFQHVPIMAHHAPEDMKPASLLWLPMWVFKVDTKWTAPPGKGNQVNRILSIHPWVWVIGFRGWRSSYFGDPGLLYTARSIEPVLLPPDQNTMPIGCSISEKEAKEYIAPFLLAIVDRVVDVAQIEVFPEILESRLVSVPFLDEGDRIKDTIIDYNWPVIFLEDILPLRAGLRRTT